jgi:hypothetical protein
MQNKLEFGSVKPNHENFKKISKKLKKFGIRSSDLFPHFRFGSIPFRFDTY